MLLGAMLGDGWYRGRLGFGGGRRNIFGDRLALLVQLEINYSDGSRELVLSDADWRANTGPILFSDIYDGEIYDARLEHTGWTKPGYADADWKKSPHYRLGFFPHSLPRQETRFEKLRLKKRKKSFHLLPVKLFWTLDRILWVNCGFL